MGSKEVVVGNPKGNTVHGSILGTVAAESSVGFLEGTIESFNDLFKGTELFGDLIIVGKANDLSDKDIPVLLQFKLLCSKGIGTVAVSNEAKGFAGEFLELIKCHAHGQDARTDISRSRNLITQNRSGHSVNDEPDIGFHAFDLDVGLISGQFIGRVVVIGIHERADKDSRSFGIVIHHGVRDINSMDILKSLCGFAQGKAEVYPVRETKAHDVCTVPFKAERGCPFRELVEFHVEEVDGELPVEIAELILPVVGLREIRRKLFEIVPIKGALVIDALMYAEMFPVLDRLKSMSAVRTLEVERCSHFLAIHKGLTTDLAFELSASTGIIVDVIVRGTAKRADGIFGNGTNFAFLSFDWHDRFAIAEAVVFVPELPVLFDKGLDDRESVGGEFLILRTMNFVMSPLLERDVSADEENKPANLLRLFLNYSE